MISRRQFLGTITAGAAGLAVGAPVCAAASPARASSATIGRRVI